MADILVAQYFQQVPPLQLSLPDGPTLLQPAVQTSLYERMFADTDTSTNADTDTAGTETGNYLPPASYQTRVLKMIITRMEESISDPEDVCPYSVYIYIYIYIYVLHTPYNS